METNTHYAPPKVAKSNEIPEIHKTFPKPGQSHINYVLRYDYEPSYCSDDDMSESEKCCTANYLHQQRLDSVSLIFTKWELNTVKVLIGYIYLP